MKRVVKLPLAKETQRSGSLNSLFIYHFTVLPAEIAKCFIGLNDINILTSVISELLYVHPYFCAWGKEGYARDKTDYLCPGSLAHDSEKSNVIVIYILFS